MTWFSQSLFFSSSSKKKTKQGKGDFLLAQEQVQNPGLFSTYFGFPNYSHWNQISCSPIPVPVGSPPWAQNPEIKLKKIHGLHCMTRDAKPAKCVTKTSSSQPITEHAAPTVHEFYIACNLFLELLVWRSLEWMKTHITT